MRLALLVLTLLAVPAAAQAQVKPPQGWVADVPMFAGSSCMQSGGSGICNDTAEPKPEDLPPVPVAPGATVPLRFNGTVDTLTADPAIGTLVRTGDSTWNLQLAPSTVGGRRVLFLAHYAGAQTGTAPFTANLVVNSPSVVATLTRSIARARLSVPAGGTVTAFVRVNGKRRSGVLTRTYERAGIKRLRVKIRGNAASEAWLVVRYTFPGAMAVEISQRLNA